MLANDSAADAVLDPAACAAGGDRMHLAMVSISPLFADSLDRRFTEAGFAYISAPVLGRPAVAAAGDLDILAGGAAIERAEPYLLAMGKKGVATGRQTLHCERGQGHGQLQHPPRSAGDR